MEEYGRFLSFLLKNARKDEVFLILHRNHCGYREKSKLMPRHQGNKNNVMVKEKAIYNKEAKGNFFVKIKQKPPEGTEAPHLP